jgi:hypothetical protein
MWKEVLMGFLTPISSSRVDHSIPNFPASNHPVTAMQGRKFTHIEEKAHEQLDKAYHKTWFRSLKKATDVFKDLIKTPTLSNEAKKSIGKQFKSLITTHEKQLNIFERLIQTIINKLFGWIGYTSIEDDAHKALLLLNDIEVKTPKNEMINFKTFNVLAKKGQKTVKEILDAAAKEIKEPTVKNNAANNDINDTNKKIEFALTQFSIPHASRVDWARMTLSIEGVEIYSMPSTAARRAKMTFELDELKAKGAKPDEIEQAEHKLHLKDEQTLDEIVNFARLLEATYGKEQTPLLAALLNQETTFILTEECYNRLQQNNINGAVKGEDTSCDIYQSTDGCTITSKIMLKILDFEDPNKIIGYCAVRQDIHVLSQTSKETRGLEAGEVRCHFSDICPTRSEAEMNLQKGLEALKKA